MYIEYEGYRLRPYSSGLCWELLKWSDGGDVKAGKETKPGWKSTGQYPSTLGCGLAEIHEYLLMEKRETADIEHAVKVAKKYRDDLMKIGKEAAGK